MRCISAGSSRASGSAEAESSREREQSGTCGAKAEDMDHQTLLCAHYSLQKARTLPRSHADVKNDEADFSVFLFFFFAKELLSCRDGCAGPSLKHGSRQIKTFCTSEITLLRLTRKTQRTDVVTVWIIRCSILPSGNQICRSFASEQRCDSKTCIVVHKP